MAWKKLALKRRRGKGEGGGGRRGGKLERLWWDKDLPSPPPPLLKNCSSRIKCKKTHFWKQPTDFLCPMWEMSLFLLRYNIWPLPQCPCCFYWSLSSVWECLSERLANLKGHGNEADFLGFLQKSVRHRLFTVKFEPFRFGLRIRGDIRNRKTTPWLAESGSRQECL